MFPRLPRLLKLCQIVTSVVARLAAFRLSDPQFSARSRPPTVSTPRTHFCSALFAPVSSFVQWSVSPTRRTVCDSTFEWSLQVLLLPLEDSPLFETLRPAEAPRTSHPQQASRLLRCSPSSYHSCATMRKFCLLCDTNDDQRRSTRRLHDADTCATDLRLEMAHMSQCVMSVLVKVKLRTTENKRACASNCALTSASLSLHKSGSNGLFHTSSCLKHLDFLKVKVPPLRSLPQFCGTGMSTICSSRSGSQVRTAKTKSSNRSIVCACFSTTL